MPLADFERRGIQPGIAIRALDDTRMIRCPQPGNSPTVSRQIRDDIVVGLILAPAHIEGLDPKALPPPPMEKWSRIPASRPHSKGAADMLVRRYEMPWRRAFEAHAGLVWLAASFYFASIALAGPLPVLPALGLTAACSLMASRRMAQAVRMSRLRGIARRIAAVQVLSTQDLGHLCTDPAQVSWVSACRPIWTRSYTSTRWARSSMRRWSPRAPRGTRTADSRPSPT